MRTRLHPLAPRLAAVFVLLVATAMLIACHATLTPYRRTLPDWVRRVYVPMAVNKTYEPGLEELVTSAFIEEIEADGRLESTTKSKADLIARVTLEEYRERSAGFESDDIESSRQMELIVSLDLFEPKDTKTPYARVGSIPIRLSYGSDYRSYSAELDVDARQRLVEATGRTMLQAMMTQAEILAR